jgi:hypothetical protein
LNLELLLGQSRSAKRAKQVPDAPGDIDPRDNQDNGKEGHNNHRLLKLKPVIKDLSKSVKSVDVNLKEQVEARQDCHRDKIDEQENASLDVGLAFDGKHIGKMEEKYRNERDPRKGELYAKNSGFGGLTVDHDEFTDIPCGKCQNKTCKKAIRSIGRIAGKHDQTEGDVHGKCQG